MRLFFYEALLLLVCVSACGQEVVLTAEGGLNIYSTSEAAATDGGNPALIAPQGSAFKVISCEDKKSRFILKVQLPNGGIGFVGNGPFRLNGTPDCG